MSGRSKVTVFFFFLQNLSWLQRGSFLLTKLAFDRCDVKNASAVSVLSLCLYVHQLTVTADEKISVCLYVCVLVTKLYQYSGWSVWNSWWQNNSQQWQPCQHTHTQQPHTVCSTDTAAISYHLSRVTAGETKTDGKRDSNKYQRGRGDRMTDNRRRVWWMMSSVHTYTKKVSVHRCTRKWPKVY